MLIRLKNLFFLLFIAAFLFRCSFDETSPSTSSTEDAPGSPSPANNATDQLLVLNLDWTDNDAQEYDVYLDTQNPPQVYYVKNTTTKPVIVTGLDYSTTYYWKVIAKYADGSRVAGPVWQFKTKDQSGSSTTGNGYVLLLDSLETASPNLVEVLFHVSDLNGEGITDLTEDNFEVYEDYQELSASESNLSIKNHQEFSHTSKIVLMLDNSTSLENQIDSIRTAAESFVNGISSDQQVAIYQFSEEIETLSDFTNDKNVLLNALQNYKLGKASTDFYGAVQTGASLWEDSNDIDNIVQGTMIIFTDGEDTQGSTSLADAINAVNNKIVFSIGLGDEIEPEILENVGTAGYYNIDDLSLLAKQFQTIQTKIMNYANSFYLLSYNSPKRGDADHYLTVEIKDNPHTGDNSSILGTFNSSGFSSAKILMK
jgi:hypothetical protein